MPDAPPLELASLRSRHPKAGLALLESYAVCAVIRLAIDPVTLPAGERVREVGIERVGRASGGQAVDDSRKIGWDGLPNLADRCESYQVTVSELDVTEHAAIAVMALLIHELEGGVIDRVLPVGSGGDYYVLTSGTREQVEVSGIASDGTGAETRRRVVKKSAQVLTHARSGFVSVTTFSHPPTGGARSCLHYVRRPRK